MLAALAGCTECLTFTCKAFLSFCERSKVCSSSRSSSFSNAFSNLSSGTVGLDLKRNGGQLLSNYSMANLGNTGQDIFLVGAFSLTGGKGADSFLNSRL